MRPIFISCKTCDVKTEALNELAILRDRFGGQIARAAIVTAERGRAPMRHRAMELGIDVIDLEDLRSRPGAPPKGAEPVNAIKCSYVYSKALFRRFFSLNFLLQFIKHLGAEKQAKAHIQPIA
ncbi:MAG: hypothetical protein V8Q82_01320 [Christensenellales bacterium]